jgi:hypothetical protein
MAYYDREDIPFHVALAGSGNAPKSSPCTATGW